MAAISSQVDPKETTDDRQKLGFSVHRAERRLKMRNWSDFRPPSSCTGLLCCSLCIEWDDGPHAKLNTKDIADELEKATLNSGPVAQNIGDVDAGMSGSVTKVEA